MPTLYMLIGVPGAGKSTWIKKQDHNAVVLSTDNYIEDYAAKNNTTYSAVFRDVVGTATNQMNHDLQYALKNGKDIIWDQTNTTVKSRRDKLKKIPSSYRKVAVFFSIPPDLRERLAGRPGKFIPDAVLLNMINQLEPPTKAEGFDEIINAS